MAYTNHTNAQTAEIVRYDDPPYLHPSGFILRPDETIVMLVQSSGAIGRLTADDTIGLINNYQNPN